MGILDKHFIALTLKKKSFVIAIGFAYFIIAIIGFKTGFMNLVESFLILVIGMIYSEFIKLQYRIEDLEKKKKQD